MGNKKSKAAPPVPPEPHRPTRGGTRDALAGTVPVATFATLADVEDVLSRVTGAGFPIDRTTIVGTDLRFVEKVQGRMSTARAAGYGTVTGAWLGALVASFAAIFTAHSVGAVLSMLFGGIMLGALFGAVFGVVAYRFAGPRTGITGNVTLVASRYELRTDPALAGELRGLLERDRQAGMLLVDRPGNGVPATADDLLSRP
jgi:hypothetical protein